jgi:hypothetical protein
MEMTIKEYCEKKEMEPRYIQRIIKEHLADGLHTDLLRKKWGIAYVKKMGNTYVLTVDEKHITDGKNK